MREGDDVVGVRRMQGVPMLCAVWEGLGCRKRQERMFKGGRKSKNTVQVTIALSVGNWRRYQCVCP